VKIEAYRDAGNRYGPEISDPLLAGEASMLARATAELDAHAAPTETIDLNLPFTEGLVLGMRLRVSEVERPAWVGRIIGISASADGDTLEQVITLERPVCTR
jgi:hypothetical protein